MGRTRIRPNQMYFFRALNIAGVGLAIACVLSAFGMVVLEVVAAVSRK